VSAPDASSVLELRQVTRTYGTGPAALTVLHDVDLTVEEGEYLAVVGPSGSGKSTLLTLLSGMDVPDEGEVRLGEVVLSALDRADRAALRRDSVAVVGQAPGLSGFLSPRENIELGLALRGIDDDEIRERTTDALSAVGLAAHAERRVDVLSAGQRERVALARAFAARTPAVIADEPTSRLDAVTTLEIGALFADLAHETGTTVVCATHDPLLIGLADRELRLDEVVPIASA
jgi:putative ABC transport system ATP-binding protein